jgi:glucokinase
VGIIALDVGGTSVKSAVVSLVGTIDGEVAVTPIDSAADAGSILQTLTDVIRHHVAQHDAQAMRSEASEAQPRSPLAGVAFGFPGPFDYQHGISYIRGVAKYESLYGVNMRTALRERLQSGDLPILFRNDAEAAVVGESRYGAGRPYRRLIGVTLGTGIGSAFVVDGVPVVGCPGVPPNGWLYNVRFDAGARRAQADDVFSARGLLARLHAAGAATIDIPAAAAAARHGRPEGSALRRAFQSFGSDLGVFLEPFAHKFAAEAVLVLGGLADTFDLFGPALLQRLPVPALTGQLGPRAALLGAASLLV